MPHQHDASETENIRAFTRDPRALFECAQNSLVPHCRGGQPVSYRKAVLKPYALTLLKNHCLLPTLEAHTAHSEHGSLLAKNRYQLHEVAVDWQRGGITVYMSMSDVINHVPSFQSSAAISFLPECQAQLADGYVRETFEFFRRGHSLFHTECCCAPPSFMSSERVLELGICPSSLSSAAATCRVGSRLLMHIINHNNIMWRRGKGLTKKYLAFAGVRQGL